MDSNKEPKDEGPTLQPPPEQPKKKISELTDAELIRAINEEKLRQLHKINEDLTLVSFLWKNFGEKTVYDFLNPKTTGKTEKTSSPPPCRHRPPGNRWCQKEANPTKKN